MKISVNIDKNISLFWLGAILILAGIFIVYAYNANGQGGNPAIMGHSADELNVKLNCEYIKGTIGGSSTALCSPGYTLTGGYCLYTKWQEFAYDDIGTATNNGWYCRIGTYQATATAICCKLS